ncbi:MAG TPA: hypothetical protein VLF14_00015 [Candidatus Binatia bacterium]|nr:hypothetical protein [Candidatus Binatia bacterium]
MALDAPMGGGMGWSWSSLALFHAAAFVLLVAVALGWGRHGRRRPLVRSGFAAISVIVLGYAAAIRPSDIPIDWITILSHGLEGKSIMHLYARGLNVGMSFDFIVSAVAAGPRPTLHDVVWLNLLLTLCNAAIFLHIALYVAGPVWAVVWTLVFALNPAMFLASFSELPSHLLTLYFLAGVIAWAVVIDPLGQPRLLRAAAYALAAVLTVLAGLTRIEVALIGAVALALQAGHALLGQDRWAAAGSRLAEIGRRFAAYFSDRPAAVAVLCVVGAVLSFSGLPVLLGRSEISSVYPFNPSFLLLFAYLPMLALPIGVSVAVLFGFVGATLEFRRLGGLALSLFVLVRLYFAAQYQYFEMGRYLSHILAPIFLLGLFGREVFETIARRWPPTWYRAARIVYVMAWFTLPLPGIVEYYLRPEYEKGGGFAQVLLDRNNQRETRYLIALTERNPECVFVARVVEDRAVQLEGPVHRGDPKIATKYVYVVFGGPIAQPIQVGEDEASLEEVVARHAPGASCVRLYYGGDCNLTFTDRCKEFVAGRRLVDEERFWSRPYNNPLQSGYGAPEIILATYAWP